MSGFNPRPYRGPSGSMDPRQGGENAAGQQWSSGQMMDPNEWTYSTNYSGTIPEGARTYDPNAPAPTRDPRTGAILHKNPLWTQGGDEYYWLNEDGTPAGSTGFNGSNVSNAPWNNQSPAPRQGGGGGGATNPFQGGGGGGQPDPYQGGGRMQPQNQSQPWGSGGATDPFQGGGGGGATDPYQGGQGPRMSTQAGGYGQSDPYQGGWGGTNPSMAGRMLGSMFGQRR